LDLISQSFQQNLEAITILPGSVAFGEKAKQAIAKAAKERGGEPPKKKAKRYHADEEANNSKYSLKSQ
jgi:hypothetical protein